ncbi:MAG: FAD-dependent oxidoreductase [Chryseolinea sp.]
MEHQYDIIVIGAGSGGLSVSLFMQQAGFKTLLIDKSDHQIGGDCLNDGCVPSKALIHVSRIIHQARQAEHFGLKVDGSVDAKKVSNYISQRQEVIRAHENAAHFRAIGLDVALGEATFADRNAVLVASTKYRGRKIVIATGSKPKRLAVPGVDTVKYYDNESIFDLSHLPTKLLVVGGGPIGIEIGQAMLRLGVSVTLLQKGRQILPNDHPMVARILEQKLKEEGMSIFLNTALLSFPTPTTATISFDGKSEMIDFDAVFVATGRESNIDLLQLDKAGIETENGQIKSDRFLRTTNKDVYVCGDVAGDLKFSHAAEHHARIILNNLFSPMKKKQNNDHLSWVTFTDPEVATFGLNEKQLNERGISFTMLNTGFEDDDRAVVDDHRYSRLILLISNGGFLKSRKLLGGTMIAPNSGELIQELILANSNNLSIDTIFNKIYPYPVASRINQKIIVDFKSKSLTPLLKKLLGIAFKIFR